MKKVLSIILAVTLLALSAFMMTSCKKTHECEFCGEEKKCDTITLYDKIVYACDDCVAENRMRKCDFCGEEKKCRVNLSLGEPMYICNDCVEDMNGFFGE